jgi:hypothetical protein
MDVSLFYSVINIIWIQLSLAIDGPINKYDFVYRNSLILLSSWFFIKI